MKGSTSNVQRSTSNVQVKGSMPNSHISTFNVRSPRDARSPYDLEERLLNYSTEIIRLVERLPNSKAGNHVARQLLRSGTGTIQQKTVVNLKAIEDGHKEDITLLPNDIIIVPRRIF